jgi:hypothetical protein
MNDTVHKFSGIVRAIPTVPLNELSDDDRAIAEQETFEISVELIDIADYDPECGESLEVWALLNEFHETVAVDTLDHFNFEFVGGGDAQDRICPKCGHDHGWEFDVCENCSYGEIEMEDE